MSRLGDWLRRVSDVRLEHEIAMQYIHQASELEVENERLLRIARSYMLAPCTGCDDEDGYECEHLDGEGRCRLHMATFDALERSRARKERIRKGEDA